MCTKRIRLVGDVATGKGDDCKQIVERSLNQARKGFSSIFSPRKICVDSLIVNFEVKNNSWFIIPSSPWDAQKYHARLEPKIASDLYQAAPQRGFAEKAHTPVPQVFHTHYVEDHYI